MPLGIGYFVHGFVDIIGYEGSGIWFHFFLSYPMSPGIRELALWQGIGFRRTVEGGRAG